MDIDAGRWIDVVGVCGSVLSVKNEVDSSAERFGGRLVGVSGNRKRYEIVM